MPSCMYSSGSPRSALPGQAHFIPDAGYALEAARDCSRLLTSSGRRTPDQWYAPFGSAGPAGGATGYEARSPDERAKSRKPAGKRSTYKHVPHRDKPPHLVQRRNARERRRVQAVNNAFVRLRRHIPHENKNKRLSKVKTLRIAIDYISQLQQMIKEHDAGLAAGGAPYQAAATTVAPPAGVVAARSRRLDSRMSYAGRRPDNSSTIGGYDVTQFADFSKEGAKLWINMNFVSR